MGYKRWSPNMSFGEMALSRSLEKNRSLQSMERINKVIDWVKVEKRLWIATPLVARKKEPMPILLCYCSKNGFVSRLTLNWRIKLMIRSLSKRFWGLPLEHPSPDH